jgi:hypothetical protein
VASHLSIAVSWFFSLLVATVATGLLIFTESFTTDAGFTTGTIFTTGATFAFTTGATFAFTTGATGFTTGATGFTTGATGFTTGATGFTTGATGFTTGGLAGDGREALNNASPSKVSSETYPLP